MREGKEAWWLVAAIVAVLLGLLFALQLSPLVYEERGWKPIYPPPLPTPDASTCTAKWNEIDRSSVGQRVCVRGSLHNASSFDSFFGTESQALYLRRPIGSGAFHEGDCLMAGGVLKSDGAHALYIQADSLGRCPPELPAWLPWGH